MFCEILEKKLVIFDSLYLSKEIFPSGTRLISVGSTVKVIMKEVIKPNDIIHPKSIIGFNSLNIRDKKAEMIFLTTDGYYVASNEKYFFISFSKYVDTVKGYREILVEQAKRYRKKEL